MTLHKVLYALAFVAYVVAAVLALADESTDLGTVGFVAIGAALYTLPKLISDRTL